VKPDELELELLRLRIDSLESQLAARAREESIAYWVMALLGIVAFGTPIAVGIPWLAEPMSRVLAAVMFGSLVVAISMPLRSRQAARRYEARRRELHLSLTP
jgi:hypothetical protein